MAKKCCLMNYENNKYNLEEIYRIDLNTQKPIKIIRKICPFCKEIMTTIKDKEECNGGNS
jgi:hypothetical protein